MYLYCEMTTRRDFIKAGALTSLAALPGMANATPNWSLLSANDLPSQVRSQLLVPAGRTYLNTGSLGPSPRAVVDAVYAAMQQLESNPVSENWGPLGEKMEAVRKKVAGFINATTEEIILTRNTTEGLNLIAQSLSLQPGDEILTTTDEHGGGEVGLEYLAKTRGAVVRKFDMPLPATSVEEVVQTVMRNLTAKTRYLMLSHINTSSGMRMPFAEIAAITRPRGIILVADGAQAPGLIAVDVKALGVDAYAASGHKWMLGPKETGFVYLRKEFQPSVQPVFSMYGYQAYTQSSGTRNVATIIGLGAAIDWIQQIGMSRIEAQTLDTRNYCLAQLQKLDGLKIISPALPALSCGIVSFSPTRVKNDVIYNELKKKDIIVKVLTKHNANRISCHLFVSRQDIDTFITALKPLL